jgi:8-oxo-dGTP diphosphatase
MPRRRAAPGAQVSVDCLCFTVHDGRLAVLVRLDGARRERGELPWASLASGRQLAATARRFLVDLLGGPPAWTVQAGAFGDATSHPAGSDLSVAYLTVLPAGREAPEGLAWCAVSNLPDLPARHEAEVAAGLAALRERMDLAPVAFRLLPERFTLTELQQIYELLLGRRLHKASFRRALAGASLVEATDEWRSEGRGRPAQLHRYGLRKRRGTRRPVRFDLLP